MHGSHNNRAQATPGLAPLFIPAQVPGVADVEYWSASHAI